MTPLLEEDEALARLFLIGHSMAALGQLLKATHYVDFTDEYCRGEAEDAVRRAINHWHDRRNARRRASRRRR